MHICVGNLTIIGSDNGLSPGRRQAIIWTNAGILLIGPLGTNFQWNFNQNSNIFIKENVFASVICEMASILFRPQSVKCISCLQELFWHCINQWCTYNEEELETINFIMKSIISLQPTNHIDCSLINGEIDFVFIKEDIIELIISILWLPFRGE